MWICHSHHSWKLSQQREKSSNVRGLTTCCSGDTQARQNPCAGAIKARIGVETLIHSDYAARKNESVRLPPLMRLRIVSIGLRVAAQKSHFGSNKSTFIFSPRAQASQNSCGSSAPLMRALGGAGSIVERYAEMPAEYRSQARRRDQTRSASLTRSALLRSLGSSSFLRNRIAFGVISTSSSSVM